MYLAGGPKIWQFGFGEGLILAAILFWAVEFIIAKKALIKLSGLVVAWGRMFFGSIFLLGFLYFTNRLVLVDSLNGIQWIWLIGTSILLFGYVTTWYTGLKHAPANVVTAILTIGFPITVILNSIFISHKYDAKQLVGLGLICLAVYLFVKISQKRLRFKNEPVRV